MSAHFQGFSFLYFRLSKDVLVELELALPEDDLPGMVHYFNPKLDFWVKMKVDSTITIASPGQQLFFKAIDVKRYPAFDRLYGSRYYY
ncbi:hypothetical protein JVU11DRAFT_1947 [Chiua virens]|nr:hypothetical protein JVU11DRAFT_1947 [Chiua virens]